MSNISDLLSINSEGGSKITTRIVVEQDKDDHEAPTEQFFLIEGDRKSLRFLAELILTMVESDTTCNLHLHPDGAGSAHFSPDSTVGIYLHRLPCDLHPDNLVR